MNKVMRNLTIFGALSVCATGAAVTEHLAEKMELKNAKKDSVSATLISRAKVENEDVSGVILNLDLDTNPKTTEASVVVSDVPVTDKLLENTIPTGSKRTVWEWKRLGEYSSAK